ncbi:MAG: hypothetical protein ABR954_01720 [Dehalococcoidales bacterium]
MTKWPTYNELLNVCNDYVQKEQGDTNYEIPLTWVQQHWDDTQRLAGAVRIFEETWNRAFYNSARGIFDMTRLTNSLEKLKPYLNTLKSREIDSFGQQDEQILSVLWNELFESLRPRNKPDRPFIATTKALHLLIPTFFVPLDNKIDKHYSCNIVQPQGYIKFQHLMAEFASFVLNSYVTSQGGDINKARSSICGDLYIQKTGSKFKKSLAKILDEYNWMIYSQKKG